MARTNEAPLAGVSVETLRYELRRRERLAGGLQRKSAALVKRAADVAVQIRHLGASPDGGPAAEPRPRPRNEATLADALAAVLKGRQMGVTEVAEAVQRAGYRTTSKTFRTIVNQCLIRETKRFRKVERGLYTAR